MTDTDMDELDRPLDHYRDALPGSSRTRETLPRGHGYFVYFLWADGGHLLYVGQTDQIRSRISHHLAKPWVRVTWMSAVSRADALLVEKHLIARFAPEFNLQNDLRPERAPREEEPILMRASKAAALLSVHPRTLARWSDQGILPQPTRLGPRGDRHYLVADIEAALLHGATS